MEEFIILLIFIYAIVMTVGALLQKYAKLPWMFTIILTGLVFANVGLFKFVETDPAFKAFSNIGQLCLLFTIGLSIDFKEFRKLAKDLFIGNFITCFAEGIGLSLLFYFVMPAQFSNSYLICFLTGVGFATIGEVILIAILTELKIERTKFGQLTIGMGIADDFLEITILTFVSTLPFFYSTDGSVVDSDPVQVSLKWIMLAVSLLIIFGITFVATKIGNKSKNFLMKLVKDYPFVNGVLYLTIFLAMISIGGMFIKEVEVLGAIFAGIMCQAVFPEKIAEKLEGNFKFLMMFVGPFFFFMVGYKISILAIVANLFLVILIIAVSIGGRVGSTVLVFRRHFKEARTSITFGFGLCTKFSTSIVILAILLEHSYITPMIYSVIMTAFLAEKVVTVLIYSVGVGKMVKRAEEAGGTACVDDCFRTDLKDLKTI
ncbi:MAG: cation:proton antiporter [Candidatus Lokiarchaeota archaeon]|nr:cation:proton antiporter [Candidatus Lokiarchaeota archaeon]